MRTRTMITLILMTALSLPALAQPMGTTLASGFNGPMGVLVAPDGTVWVIDSGLGGDTRLEISNPESGEAVEVTVGDS